MTKLPLESLVEEQALPERVSQVGGTARERKELYFELESRPAGAFSTNKIWQANSNFEPESHPTGPSGQNIS